MSKSRLLLIIGLILPYLGLAQIVDDSTKQVYGPSSTGFLYEKNFLEDDTALIHPDTLINDFRFTTINKQNGWLWQDLGNEGTAAKHYLFQTPINAYTESGWNAFSPFYAPKTEDIKYYNTHSPYTKMLYTQSFNGLLNLGFTHSQNINRQWNITLDMRRITSSKQWSSTGNEDRLVDHWDMNLTSNFTSKNRKYTALLAYTHFHHRQLEQGGVETPESGPIPPEDIKYDYNTNFQQLLYGVESDERWNNLHAYHQFKLSKGIQLFHSLDYERKKYFHKDTLISENNQHEIYPDTVTAEKMKNYYFFHNIQNRFGFKGYFHGFKYSLGLTNRIYAFNAKHLGESGNTKTEVLVGGNIGYWLPDSLSFLNTEVFLGVGSNINVFLKSDLKYKKLDVGFKFITKPAYLFYNNFNSEVISWENNFKNITYTQLQAKYSIGSKKAWLTPSFRVNLVSNHLYFDQNQTPQQLEEEALIYDLELDMGIQLKNWKFSNRFIHASSNHSDIFRMPSIINNTNIEYHVFYANVLHLYFGLDIYYRPSFKADAYSPVLRSFYLQDTNEVWGYPIADIYSNFMIKRVKLAFSYSFVNQSLPINGFYTTPSYLAMRRTFFLKVNWPLFD